MSATIDERVARVRSEMGRHELAAYVVPSTDPHQSEYVPPVWQRRAWISGFSGSAGTAVITRDSARLWTDSRYWLQAARQLEGSCFELMRQGDADVPNVGRWLASVLVEGEAVGIDPRLLSVETWRDWKRQLERAEARLVAVDENLVDAAWVDRAPLPSAPMLALGTEFAGRDHCEKLADLRAALEKERCDAHVITALDSIAWLFNVRGRDIECNPLAISYAIVSRSQARLFVAREKITEAVAEHLGAAVDVEPYESFAAELDQLARDHARVWIDPHATSVWVAERLAPEAASGATLHEEASPIVLAKAVKNEVELGGMRACHVRDGAAVCRFLRWVEESVRGGERLDEVDCHGRLEAFRAEGKHFQGESFPTISAFGPNAAIVHYRAQRPDCAVLEPNNLYLVDSGAQYLDGTTDITRTIALGEPTDEQRESFTRVLKGCIAVATVRFPTGTSGAPLDALARRPLWDGGRDFGHGTGHGVGHFLCVHEGPHGIALRSSKTALRPGMIVSDEPGYYKAGEYGIRIENLVEVVPAGEGADGQPFLGFRELTLCPIDKRCIDPSLLSAEERDWLDRYHARVRQELAPELADPADRAWLERSTEPL
jgi:Xaa-Pro aminopeptidase